MVYQLKTRQICLFFIAFLPIVKLFMLPSILAGSASQDMWISSLLSALLDGFTLFIIIMICKKQQKNFFEILEDSFGKTAKTIIMVLYFIYFILKAIMPTIEQIQFNNLTLYAKMPSTIYILPLFVAIFYLCTKKLRVVGRSADIIWIFTLNGYFLLMGLATKSVDLTANLPILTRGFLGIAKGSYYSLSWFGDACYAIFFIGKFKYEKRSGIKIMLSYFFSTLLVVIFMLFFYGTFSSIGYRQQFALTEIAKYTTVINDTSRFDIIAIILMMFSSIFSIALPLFFACRILDKLLNIKQNWISALIIVALIFIPSIVLGEYYASIQYVILNYCSAFFLIMGNVLPVLTIFFIKKEKRNETLKA